MNRSRILERSQAEPARRFGALADPARLEIVALLRAEPRCVCELRDDLGMASNLLSYHLRILREAGFVHGERHGRRIEYRLEPGALERIRRDVAELAGAPVP
jgi:ArsR family transcriptional regulator, arsenate/arsenite/antimonite-responsive transcriptional repressor